MKGEMNIYYDEEGDFLEIQIGDYTEGYFRDIAEDIAERVDEKTGEITGLAILSFRKRTQQVKELKIHLPLKIELSA